MKPFKYHAPQTLEQKVLNKFSNKGVMDWQQFPIYGIASGYYLDKLHLLVLHYPTRDLLRKELSLS